VNHSIFWTNLCSPKSFVDVTAASPEVHKQKEKRQKKTKEKKDQKVLRRRVCQQATKRFSSAES
jgi:hypothetical protein